MNRGERISNRTKSAIKNALLALMQEQNYPDITVSNITQRGNVGRSTLYKHYQSKADVLVDIHRDIFQHLFSGLSTWESWLTPEPPSELMLFFEKYLKLGRNPFSLSYKLGNDLDYLINHINLNLWQTIEEKLRSSIDNGDSSIPLAILARSISCLYSGLIISWFTRFQASDIRSFAAYIHRMARALILEATGKSTYQIGTSISEIT